METLAPGGGQPPSSGSVGAPPINGQIPPQIAQALAKASSANIVGAQRKTFTSDADYLQFFNDCKREAFADWTIYERQWTKIIHYLNNRQWLAPYSAVDGWRDARMPRNVPKPVTNKAREADIAIRAMFASIKFGVMVRPANQSNDAISTATTADNLAPVLHDLHEMDAVMNEADYWLVNNGNVVLHSAWDYDVPYGRVAIPWQECAQCGLQLRADMIARAGQKCAACGGTQFRQAIDQQGKPRVDYTNQGGGVTTPLSLLQVRFPLTYQRWRQVPFLIIQRWRDKRYYENHPKLRDYVDKITWAKTAQERSLQIFQSLPYMNDLPATRGGGTAWGSTTSQTEGEGVAEYELWHRPTPMLPEGLVLRVAGDGDKPIVIHLEDDEGLPGDLPYHDGRGNPLFTFSHAGFQNVGGRVVASGAHDAVMPKYDALNRLDSFIEMITFRMAAPQWMIPKGSEVQWLGDSPGTPGLLLNWNPQLAGTGGRPERIPGIPPDAALIRLREMLMKDIEDGLGTYDVLRGARPTGVEAFSALQLLVERGQDRFTNPFRARGSMYQDWFGFAIELEREFGPTDRIIATQLPTRKWTFKTFRNADLKGDVTIIVEDGTQTPKTALGQRASIEHLKQLGFIDAADPDQRYAIFQQFGETSLIPAIDAHVQAALKKQEDFIEWVTGGKLQALVGRVNQNADLAALLKDPLAGYPFALEALVRSRHPSPGVHEVGELR
jgi:hypothetical protein